MNSEEPMQVESSSSTHGHHDTQQVQTVLESASVPLSESMTKSTELTSRVHDPDLSMTVEGEVESTAVLDRTLVEGEGDASSKKHAKVSSANSLPFPFKLGHASKRSGDSHSTGHDRSVEGGSPRPWHPLHTMGGGGETQGMVDDIGESKGKLSYAQTDMKTSHLQLELKPASAEQPWDSIDPPLENNLKSMEGYYSPQQRFPTMQNGARPLIPKSSYYFGPPAPDSAYGTAPTGHIGVHHPREILRVERDYTGGELIQFAPIYPLELEGRITPTQFLESINAINELLISAHTLRHSFLDNMVAIFSLQISKLFLSSHFEREMIRLGHLIDDLNMRTFNPVGLNIIWPRNVGFLYLEIEYY